VRTIARPERSASVTEHIGAPRVFQNGGVSFPTQYQQLMRQLRERGLDVSDMRQAQALELNLGGGGLEPASAALAGEIRIERLEGPVIGRPVPAAATPSRLRYFLDGTQYTYPAFFVKHIPVFSALSAAAILTRDRAGNAAIVPGTLRMQHAWIIPSGCQLPEMQSVCDSLRSVGARIVDPLSALLDDEERYARSVADYGHIERKALQAARKERENLERELLRYWSQTNNDDGWIVVDGALREPVPHAVGLVKSFTYQYLTGEESAQLFGLKAQHRTGAFIAANRWRQAEDDDEREHDPTDRVLWYLRFWDATGRDARHALVRIEAAADLVDSEQIDTLSAWLLAERAPRATADSRWDTLLYPIHLLERMLKRRVSADTLAWPGARQRA
jgi:hypothetical protein